ncbi:DUF1513 domain-containing protein [Teredinibacter turnerae]|uniref:DUF1513 domain-containing protein n=1 Tax=Teredinibacter turnerae TaxID=2426 RepID=UPI0005F86902|nr:DUF1513 domain-containing protein [Teredinibacter turnerae]
MNRRQLLQLSALAFGGLNLPAWALPAKPPAEVILSAQGKNDFGLGWMDEPGLSAGRIQTGFRGHQVVGIGRNRILMVARRPGRTLAVADLASRELNQSVDCPANRVLAGHACVSPDGRTLFTTEADETDGAGYIGIYRADTLARTGEFSSGGIGPHQLAFMPDGRTLVVANGGLHTRAETGKKVLNLATMKPNLTYLDGQTGAVQEQQYLAEAKAGIRHLAVTATGDVVFATQLQRAAMDNTDVNPLGWLHRRGESPRACSAPVNLWAAMDDYAGSVAVNSRHATAGITSPRGDIACFFRIGDGALAGYHRFHDVCGIASTSDDSAFVLSNSQGLVRVIDAATLKELPERRQTYTGWQWDNHLSVMTL